MFSFMAGILGGLATSVLTVFIPLMILAGVVCAALPLAHVWWRRKKRFDAFLEQLPMPRPGQQGAERGPCLL